jgi:RNA polymerase sigma-70 factor (ECF subfamily)
VQEQPAPLLGELSPLSKGARDSQPTELSRQFEVFFGERQNYLLGIAYRVLRDREAALDLLQEVAVILYQHWHKIDHQQNIDGWLYRVTINACYRWLRTQVNFDAELGAVDAESCDRYTLQQEDYLCAKQFQTFLAKALTILSEQERVAYILRDLEGHSGKDIAQLMGCEATTARGYYFAARKKLAIYIEKNAPEWLTLIGKGDAR